MTPDTLHVDVCARIRPGYTVQVRNVSETGLAIDTERRLAPGAIVDVTVVVGEHAHRTKARVVRCCVVGVQASDIRFAGGLAFEKQLPMPLAPKAPEV